MKRLFRYLGSGRNRIRREVDAEIEAHLDERISDLRRGGLSQQDARDEAYRRFGDMDEARGRLYRSAARRDRRTTGFESWDSLKRDLSLTARRARSNPGHTALTLAIFTIGIGLTTLTYGIVDQILRRPLPFPAPDRLVQLQSMGESLTPFSQVSSSNWADWRDESESIVATGIYRPWDLTLQHGDRALRVTAVGIAGAFFETLRPTMLIGRPLTEGENERKASLAVVSQGFWERALGSQTDLDDLDVMIDGSPARIVGVVRAGFEFPEDTDVWTPANYARLSGGGRNNISWNSVARLGVGVELVAARDELQSIADRIRTTEPEALYSYGVGIRPLREEIVGPADAQLKLLMWAALVVLLVVCVNLAGLALARGAARSREIAVRTALGAGRARLVRQLLVEHMTVGVIGGGLGILLAAWVTGAMASQLGAYLPRAHGLAVDLRVAALGLGLSLVAGALAGIIPALRVSNAAPADHMGGTPGSRRRGRNLPGATLVVAEVTLAVALLSGAGLLVRSFDTLLSRDLGFEADGVAILLVALTGPGYAGDDEAVTRYWDQAIGELNALPGVRASVANAAPTARGGGGTFLEVEGVREPDVGARYRVVSDDYFDVVDIPIAEGRTFDVRDQRETERVVLVNASFAEHFWPGQSALGKRIKASSFEAWTYGGTAPWLAVIGVVGDVMHDGFESNPTEELYVLYRQIPARSTRMYVTVHSDGRTASGEIRAALSALDRSLAVEIESLSARVSNVLDERRMMIAMLGGFSIVTLLLSSIGIYGLIAFSVSERRREMALRIALGARSLEIRRLVFRQGIGIIAVGVLAGVVVSYWTASFLEGFLVEVTGRDPVTSLIVAALLLAVGATAILIPSHRATRADPAEVLRD